MMIQWGEGDRHSGSRAVLSSNTVVGKLSCQTAQWRWSYSLHDVMMVELGVMQQSKRAWWRWDKEQPRYLETRFGEDGESFLEFFVLCVSILRL
ncbi:hypothetical protein WN943_018058 [Citrus x changshan-huyou]